MLEYYIWLQLCLGAGNRNVKEILKYYKSPEAVFKADKNSRLESGLFTPTQLKKTLTVSLSKAIEILVSCKENGISVVCIDMPEYPFCLKVIENPPLVLYFKGELPQFDDIPAICIVGPRNVSEFGKRAAYSLGFRLAKSGFVVVSGGALGTDTYAHAGALKAGGKTVLVMGCGLLYDYLPENVKLRNAVSECGCVLSEHPPEFPVTRGAFPTRNRILSALSLGTVVVEAPEKSGSLITARYAYEQGRDVFVIPGEPSRAEYIGSNALLRDGAKPLLDTSDIFNEYIIRFPDKINIKTAFEGKIIEPEIKKDYKNERKNEKNLNIPLSKEAEIVYNNLNKQKFLPEDLGDLGLTSGELLSALTELEMEFIIKALPGGMYEIC